MRSTKRAQAWMIAAVAAIGLAACGSGDGPEVGDDVASLEVNANDGDSTPDGTSPDGTSPDGTGPESTDADTSTSVDPEDAFLEYAECMRDHGIDMPDPVRVDSGQAGTAAGGVIAIEADEATGGPDPRSDEFQEAQEACGSIMDDVMGDIEIDPEQEAEMREHLLDYAKCMREQGIDYPDPVFEDGRVTVGMGPVDMDMDEFEAANEVCGEIMGDGPFSISVAAGDVVGG